MNIQLAYLAITQYSYFLEYIIFIKAILCLFKNKTNLSYMAFTVRFTRLLWDLFSYLFPKSL